MASTWTWNCCLDSPVAFWPDRRTPRAGLVNLSSASSENTGEDLDPKTTAATLWATSSIWLRERVPRRRWRLRRFCACSATECCARRWSKQGNGFFGCFRSSLLELRFRSGHVFFHQRVACVPGSAGRTSRRICPWLRRWNGWRARRWYPALPPSVPGPRRGSLQTFLANQ